MKFTSVRIDDKTFKMLKYHLIEKDTNFNSYINNLIINDLKKHDVYKRFQPLQQAD